MKKSFLLLCFAFLLSFAATAQQWNSITSESPSSFQTQLISSNENQIIVKAQLSGFNTTEVETPHGAAQIVSLPKTTCTFEAGDPEMPSFSIPVIIGDDAKMEVRLKDAQFVDYHNIEVAPFKGHFSRQIDPETVPYSYGAAYSNNDFFPNNQVGTYDPYVLRDFRGQNIVVYPFAYNPVSKTLRVYYDLTIEFSKVGTGGENQLTRKSNSYTVDSEVAFMYKQQFINYDIDGMKYTPIEEAGDLLIICHDEFLTAMQPFVNWKKTIGRPTTIVGTSTSGNTDAAIQQYIAAQYSSNPNLTYVLLVGDVAQIPGHYVSSGSYSGKSDLWYGQVVGSDLYNDIYVGRFSAETVEQVTTQVNKIINYERDLNATATWLSIGQGVSKNEGAGSGHYGEADYQHIDNIRTDLLNYTYTDVIRDYQNLSGVTSSAAMISEHINSGVSIINYCNHGSETSWGVFSYNVSHVNALTNDYKLPIVWSVACLNGKYDYSSPCFAEAWMRATNNSNGNPTGAVGTMMSYISQPWQPPMYGQDEMADVLVESYSNNIKRTFGGTSISGDMKILDQYGSSNSSAVGTYQTWILFGDPSMTLRTAVPTAMNVTHANSMGQNATSFVVNASNGNGALATLTRNNEIMGSAIINNGSATINFTAPGATGEATLCVFGFNKVTYLATINITNGGGSQISVTATANPSVIAQGSSSTLTATPTGSSGPFTYNWTPAATLNNASIQSPTATPNQTTTYQVTVSDGSSNASANVTLTVVVPPTNLTATANGSNINLSWNAATPAANYKIYRNGSLINTVNTTNYTDSNLNPGEYCYTVRTTYYGVESPNSNQDCATIIAPMSVTASANPTAIPDGSSTTLTANVTGGNGSYAYSWSPANTLNNPNVQSPVATPTQTTTYTVNVTDGTNNANANVIVTVVKAPTNVVVNEINSQLVVSWSAAMIGPSYNVYRNNTLIASNITTTNYTDSELEIQYDVEYCYTVKAVYMNVTSPASDAACITLTFPCEAPNDFKGNYVWNEQEDFGVSIQWSLPESMQEQLQHFTLYRSENGNTYSNIAEIEYNAGQSEYDYFDAIEVGNYYYQLTASYDYTTGSCESDPATSIEDPTNNYIMIDVNAVSGWDTEKCQVFPNPTSDKVIIKAEGLQHIRVINIFGQILMDAELQGDETSLNLKAFGSGIYTIHIETENHSGNYRIVVE